MERGVKEAERGRKQKQFDAISSMLARSLQHIRLFITANEADSDNASQPRQVACHTVLILLATIKGVGTTHGAYPCHDVIRDSARRRELCGFFVNYKTVTIQLE